MLAALAAGLAACASETSSGPASAGADLSADGNGAPAARETARLATKDGAQEILIDYTPQSRVVDGSSVTEVAADINLTTTHMFNGAVRAVLIDKCSEFGKPLFEIVAQCDLRDVGGGRWIISMTNSFGACTLIEKPDNVDTAFPDWLVSRRTQPGDDIRCSQEIAVVGDGTFLTDPVNGTHNFAFQLK